MFCLYRHVNAAYFRKLQRTVPCRVISASLMVTDQRLSRRSMDVTSSTSRGLRSPPRYRAYVAARDRLTCRSPPADARCQMPWPSVGFARQWVHESSRNDLTTVQSRSFMNSTVYHLVDLWLYFFSEIALLYCTVCTAMNQPINDWMPLSGRSA